MKEDSIPSDRADSSFPTDSLKESPVLPLTDVVLDSSVHMTIDIAEDLVSPPIEKTDPVPIDATDATDATNEVTLLQTYQNTILSYLEPEKRLDGVPEDLSRVVDELMDKYHPDGPEPNPDRYMEITETWSQIQKLSSKLDQSDDLPVYDDTDVPQTSADWKKYQKPKKYQLDPKEAEFYCKIPLSEVVKSREDGIYDLEDDTYTTGPGEEKPEEDWAKIREKEKNELLERKKEKQQSLLTRLASSHLETKSSSASSKSKTSTTDPISIGESIEPALPTAEEIRQTTYIQKVLGSTGKDLDPQVEKLRTVLQSIGSIKVSKTSTRGKEEKDGGEEEISTISLAELMAKDAKASIESSKSVTTKPPSSPKLSSMDDFTGTINVYEHRLEDITGDREDDMDWVSSASETTGVQDDGVFMYRPRLERNTPINDKHLHELRETMKWTSGLLEEDHPSLIKSSPKSDKLTLDGAIAAPPSPEKKKEAISTTPPEKKEEIVSTVPPSSDLKWKNPTGWKLDVKKNENKAIIKEYKDEEEYYKQYPKERGTHAFSKEDSEMVKEAKEEKIREMNESHLSKDIVITMTGDTPGNPLDLKITKKEDGLMTIVQPDGKKVIYRKKLPPSVKEITAQVINKS